MADSSKASAGAAEEAQESQPVVKTEKQLKKEAQKNAKLAKYNEKMAKKSQAAGEVRHNPPRVCPVCARLYGLYLCTVELEGEREEASC